LIIKLIAKLILRSRHRHYSVLFSEWRGEWDANRAFFTFDRLLKIES